MWISHDALRFGDTVEFHFSRRCSANYTAACFLLLTTQRVHRDQQRGYGRDKAQKAQQIAVAHQLTSSSVSQKRRKPPCKALDLHYISIISQRTVLFKPFVSN